MKQLIAVAALCALAGTLPISLQAADGECLIPGYPNPPDLRNLGLPWCPASVSLEVRALALQAAEIQCSLAAARLATP